MSEQERRFKVEKITSYREQISQEDKEASSNVFMIGLQAACAILMISFSVHGFENGEFLTALMELFLGNINAYRATSNLKDLIQAIDRKTILEGKIKDINMEQAISKIEESKGISR